MLVVGLRKPIKSDFHHVILHNVLSRPKPHQHIGLLDSPYALVPTALLTIVYEKVEPIHVTLPLG
jgi:hypothetical protein